jgi:hypothetical protein
MDKLIFKRFERSTIVPGPDFLETPRNKEFGALSYILNAIGQFFDA